MDCGSPSLKNTLEGSTTDFKCFSLKALEGTDDEKKFSMAKDKCPAGSTVACPETYMGTPHFNKFLIDPAGQGLAAGKKSCKDL